MKHSVFIAATIGAAALDPVLDHNAVRPTGAGSFDMMLHALLLSLIALMRGGRWDVLTPEYFPIKISMKQSSPTSPVIDTLAIEIAWSCQPKFIPLIGLQ